MIRWQSLREHVRPALKPRSLPSARLIALASGLVALACIGLAGWIIEQSRTAALTGAEIAARNLTITLARSAARSLDAADLAIRLSADAAIREHLVGPALDQRLADLVRAAPQLAALRIYDGVGRPVAASDGAPASLPGLPGGARTDGEPWLVGGTRDPSLDGQAPIALARRIAGAGGVVVAAIRPGVFRQLWDTLDLGPDGAMALWSQDGQLMVGMPGAAGLTIAAPSLRHAPGGVVVAAAPDGVRRLVAYRRVDGYPFVVAVGIGLADALADWRLTRALVGGAGLVLAAASLLFGWFGVRDLRARALTARRIDQTVAELTQAREAAEQSNRAKTQFLARMSHELRTPMNAILGFSDVISRAMFGPLDDRYRQYGRDIHQSGQHLLALINDILDFSKIEAGRRELTAERIDLAGAVAETLRIEGPAIDAAGLALEVSLGDPPATLVADRRAIVQMLLNLLSNSVKFTPHGGRIRITAARTGEGLVLAVQDTGIGIAPKDHARVLEPFGQVADTATDQRSGTGLGLSIVKSLMELHGGRIVLDSELGAGTTISLWFPPWRVVI